MAENLLSIPKNAGRAIVNEGAAVACPLLGTDRFVKFCMARGVNIDRSRLLRLERLGLFAPVFRVRTPGKNVAHLSIPPAKDNDWFTKRWAWDTTRVGRPHRIPDIGDRTQEGYYSVFQIEHLKIVLSGVNLTVQMDSHIESSESRPPDWAKIGDKWLNLFRQKADSMRQHEFRRALALLCQFISDRYYPRTQGNQRTIQVSPTLYADDWISVFPRNWNWYEVVKAWDPQRAEQLFHLTPEKLKHAFEILAVAQEHSDPLSDWYQLTQFVAVRERQRLKGNALLGREPING